MFFSRASSLNTRIASACFASSTTFACVPACTLRLRSSAMPEVAFGTYRVWNGTSAVPRRWKPQPASSTSRTTSAALDDKVDQPSGDDHHLLHALAGDELLHIAVRHCQALDRRLVGLLGHADRAAQLAVDLNHQLHLVLLERRRVGLGPRRLQDVLAETPPPPHGGGGVGRERGAQARAGP